MNKKVKKKIIPVSTPLTLVNSPHLFEIKICKLRNVLSNKKYNLLKRKHLYLVYYRRKGSGKKISFSNFFSKKEAKFRRQQLKNYYGL